MPAIELSPRPVERIWGRTDLPPPFDGLAGDRGPIGEIWFEAPGEPEPELLVKYLFTSDVLSVQVHPDDGQARRRGLRSGKDEAWLILDAEPGATIGMGLVREIGREELRAAALSGGIERLLDRRAVRRGEILYSPAGTIHAIGAGLSLIEIQQNCDVTYRLYDHGRGRELHLNEAVSVARPAPYVPPPAPAAPGDGREVHVAGGNFVLERWTGARTVPLGGAGAGAILLIPVIDSGSVDGRPLRAGSVWTVEGQAELELSAAADLLIAYSGGEVRDFA
ncbi:MAG TPA: class I mannose-6-phosphate isomerase [Allosphingosinicella sp.]